MKSTGECLGIAKTFNEGTVQSISWSRCTASEIQADDYDGKGCR